MPNFMSKFYTSIKVDLGEAAKLLPNGSYLDAVHLVMDSLAAVSLAEDAPRVGSRPVMCEVRIFWEHAPFESGRDFAIVFPAKDLKEGKLPRGVRIRKTSTGLPAKAGVPAGVAADVRTVREQR